MRRPPAYYQSPRCLFDASLCSLGIRALGGKLAEIREETRIAEERLQEVLHAVIGRYGGRYYGLAAVGKSLLNGGKSTA